MDVEDLTANSDEERTQVLDRLFERYTDRIIDALSEALFPMVAAHNDAIDDVSDANVEAIADHVMTAYVALNAAAFAVSRLMADANPIPMQLKAFQLAEKVGKKIEARWRARGHA